MFGDQRRGDLGFVAQQGGGPLVWDVRMQTKSHILPKGGSPIRSETSVQKMLSLAKTTFQKAE
jgi:hypothetical protein